MKKNTIIIILVITNILSLVFAFAQNTIAKLSTEEALKQRQIAEEQTMIAHIIADSAMISQERAIIAEQNAVLAMKRAKEALEKCK